MAISGRGVTDPASLPLYVGDGSPAVSWFDAGARRGPRSPARSGVLGSPVAVIERRLAWLDWLEAQAAALRVRWSRYSTPVTRANAPLSLRVALPAAELEARLAAGLGPISLAGTAEFAATGPRGELSLAWSPPIAVELSVREWSSTRCDLVMAPGPGRRLRYPRRWFEAGFAVLNELRRRALADPPGQLLAGGR